MKSARILLALAVLCAMIAPAAATPPTVLTEEQPARFLSVAGRRGVVTSAEPLATHVGAQVLRDGGNAVDAAVAVAFALSATLPSAGNLGGGGFLLLRTPNGTVSALDFREVAPQAAQADTYVNRDGRVDRQRITLGLAAAAVPGTVAGLAEVLKRHGSWSLARVIAPARRLAERGFEVSEPLAADLARVAPDLRRYPASVAVFFPGGRPLQHGSRWVQPDLAWSLDQVARQGPDAFYRGAIAKRLVRAMQADGGLVTAADLAAYRPVWRAPLHGRYRGFDVWSMPPPSSGGVHLIQMLNVLEGFDLHAMGHNSAAALHVLTESMRQAYADRSLWLGDPAFFDVPVDWLTSRAYADEIRAAIPAERARSSSDVRPGHPPGRESPDTTQLCVVDASGLAVSLTYTLNFSYGCRAVAAGTGFLLNNEMDDFTASPKEPNAFGLVGGAANAIAPGKRPLSSMTPTIVTRDGMFVAALGSPGGSRIITTVLQALINLLDFGLNAQTAVAAPRIHHQWQPDAMYCEEGLSPDTLRILRGWGHRLAGTSAFGQAMLIRLRPDGWLEGGADARRTGKVEAW